MSQLIANFMANVHAFGVDPISTAIVSFLIVDVLVIATCLIKITIISSKEKKPPKVRKFGSY